MISLRIKLLINSFSVLGLAAISCATISYYGLSAISKKFLELSTERSDIVKKSYLRISDDNIKKIRSIYEKGLTTKGKKLLSKDMASLASMIADNSFLGVQEFLQKTFEDDKEILSATYFVAQGHDIKAWHYVSTEYPKGLRFPVIYNVKKKGWEGKTKAGQSVFISDPNILELLQQNHESVQYQKQGEQKQGEQKNGENDKRLAKLYFSIPFVDGKTGDAVKRARRRSEGIGYLRYVLSPEEMNKAISEEESNLQAILSSLQEGNRQALSESKKLSAKATEEVLFSLLIGTILVTVVGYLISILISGKMTRPLKRLKVVATEMALGNYNQQIDAESTESNDEIGVLARSFQAMNDAIRKRDAELEEINRNLEKLVEVRTSQWKEENRKISGLLNNMKQAVFSVAADFKVVAPVSKYAETVFGKVIEGMDIFQFLFHQLGRESEASAQITSNLLSAFGEGELQWSLSEVNLPSKITLKSPESESSQQVLRINYSPLYDEAETLDKVMFVVEDISELERLETQLTAQKEQLEILRQLTENDVEAVKGFFNGASSMITEGSRILRSDEVPAKHLTFLLRTLHTIKGNARTLGLMKVSSKAHEAESDLVKMRDQISRTATADSVESNVSLSPDEIRRCQNGIALVRSALAEYLSVAKAIYGIKNDLQAKVQTELHHALVELGWLISRRVSLTALLFQIETISGLAVDLDEMPVHQTCLRLKQDYSDGRFSMESPDLLGLIFQGVALIYRTGVFSQHTTQASIWVGLADHLWSVSNALEDFQNLPFSEAKLPFMSAVEQAISFCILNGLDFFTGYFVALDSEIRRELEGSGVQEVETAQELEKEIWKQLLFVAQFHVGLKLAEKDKKSVASCLAVLADGPAGFDVILESLFQFDHWLISLTRHFSRKEGLLTQFYQRWASRVDLGIEQFFHTIVHLSEIWVDRRIDFRESLTKGRSEPQIRSLLVESVSPRKFLNSYLKTLDILQLIAGSIEDPELLKGRYRTLEILEMNINNLKSYLLNRLYALGPDEEVRPIIQAVDRLLEVPLKPVLWSFQRVIEDLTHKLGKKVNFRVQGDDVMLSKETLSLVQDGVMHILRNAIDHGVESEEDRIQAKKPPVAELSVRCAYQYGQIVISVQDDGRGIDPDKVAAIAIEKGVIQGVIDAESEKELTPQQKMELILVPGFSTRSEVTELSGRGMGLDVAKHNVEQLGGQLKIQSELGKGSKFELVIPI